MALGGVLAQRGVTTDQITELIPTVFGPIERAVVTGSVAAGLGNSTSDLDVYVVVDNDEVASFPLQTFVGDTRLDICLFPLSRADAWERTFVPPFRSMPRQSMTDQEHTNVFLAMDSVTRFEVGLELGIQAQSRPTYEPHVLRIAVENYWRNQALRMSTVNASKRSWADPRDMHRGWVECCFALLEAHVASAGDIYQGRKWLGAKLRRSKPELFGLMETLLDYQTPTQDLVSMADELGLWAPLADGTDVGEAIASVSLRTDVEIHSLPGMTLATRWRVLSRHVPKEYLELGSNRAEVWSGRAADGMPSWVVSMVDVGLATVSIHAARGQVS